MSNRSPGIITVRTNSFAFVRAPTKTFFHYDVTFQLAGGAPGPQRPLGSDQRRRLLDRIQTQESPDIFMNSTCPYDGKANLYSVFQFPSRSWTLPLAQRPGARTCTVTMNLVNTIEPRLISDLLQGRTVEMNLVLNVMTLLNVLIRHSPFQRHPFSGGSFFPGQELKDLNRSKTLQLWRGYFQSVRITKSRLVVNIDITAAIMYRGGKLVDLMMDHFQLRDTRQLRANDERQLREWQKFVKGLKITLSYGDDAYREREKVIRKLVPEGASYEFEKDGQRSTVAEYFLNTYNLRLQYPWAVAVDIGRGAVIPLECCIVVKGQFYRGAIAPDQMKTMLDFSKQKPHERLDSIKRAGNALDHETSPVLIHSGIQISKTPIDVGGRRIDPPRLQFSAGELQPSNGAWNMLGQQFFKPCEIASYAVLVYKPNPQIPAVEKAVMDLIQACRSVGMNIVSGRPPVIPYDGHGNIRKQLEDVNSKAREVFKKNAALLIVVLPYPADNIRRSIKHFGDVEFGVATQCLVYEKFVGARDQYHKNVAINAKLGGVNSYTVGRGAQWLSEGPTMILGADVSHPGPKSSLPSIAAVVSSVDHRATTYVATSAPQSSRVEIIESLSKMIVHLAQKFYEYNQKPPARLVFYRDGLSEGEFDIVAEQEIRAIKIGLEEYWKANKAPVKTIPPLTYVVSIKRHHVRFFPDRQHADKTGNLPAGFVVDRDITGPNGKDYFLLSHSGLLGTSRPAHYAVIRNELNMSQDLLQALSFELAHLFARATRSVSIPAPVFYADLVAGRGKFHLAPEIDFSDASTDGGRSDEILRNFRNEWKPVHINAQRTMYWI